MSEIPSTPLSSPAPQANDPLRELQSTCATLRIQLVGVLIVLIVLGLGLNIFLLRQVGLARKQSAEIEQFVGAYAKTGVPQLNDFLAKLREFSKTHPDFTPILNKYFLPPGKTDSTPALSPAAAPPQP